MNEIVKSMAPKRWNISRHSFRRFPDDEVDDKKEAAHVRCANSGAYFLRIVQ